MAWRQASPAAFEVHTQLRLQGRDSLLLSRMWRIGRPAASDGAGVGIVRIGAVR